MLDLGELLLHIRADTSEAEKSVGSIGSTIQSGLGTAATAVAGAVAAATAAVVAFGTASVKTGMDFDSAMSQVAATMGTTTEEIGQLRDFALEMGATTSFTATEAAEALNYMALAGYSADQSMEMLPNVLNLAAAGNIDLARASDMVTDAQSALGLSMEETNTMVDQMAKTSSTTNTSVAQLGDAILTIGATAQTVHGGTQELTQVLGLLADNGIKGAEGGTHLRNVILSLQSPTDKAAVALQELGVSAYDNNGNFRSLEDIFQDLTGSLDGLTEQERQEALSTIFNKTDLASVNALLGTDKERWDEVAEAIDGATGSAQKMAETQLDNLAGDVTLFQSALEGAKIVISDQVTPTLREFVQFGTNAVTELSEAFKEGGLSGAMEALGRILTEGLNMVISKLPEMVNAGMQLLGALGQGLLDNLPTIIDAAMQIVLTVVNGILQALPHLATAAVQIITQLVSGLAKAAPQLIPAAVEAVLKFVEGLTRPEGINQLINSAVELINGIVEGLIKALPILIQYAPQIIANLVVALVEAIPQLLECGWDLVRGLLRGIVEAISLIPEAIGNLVRALVDGFKNLLGIHSPSTVFEGFGKDIVDGLLNGLKETWDNIVSFFTEKLGAIKDKVVEVWNNIKEKTTEIWGNIKEKLQEKGNEIKEKITETWNNIKEKTSETRDNIKEKVTTVATNTKEKLQETWTNIKDKITELNDNLKEKLQEHWDNIKEKVTDAATNIKEKVQEHWSNMKEKVTELTEEIKSRVHEKWEEMKSRVGSFTEELSENVRDKWTSMKENVSDLTENLRERVSDLWNQLSDRVSDAASDAREWATDHFNNMADAVNDAMDNLYDWATNAMDNVVDFFAGIDLWNIGSNIIDSLWSGLQSAWSSVTSWASNAVSNLRSTISNAVSSISSMVSGSHRTGLREVPYDGYIAELHRGEMVLTQPEAARYRGDQNTVDKAVATNNTINFNGNYTFANEDQIDYFMNRAGQLIKRKVGYA